MAELPSWVAEWCRTFVGETPTAGLFVVSHLSEVVGVRLAGGREIVVKRRPDDAGRALTCVAAQRLLAERGFPCPMPVTEAVIADGFAVHAEEFVGGGDVDTEESPAAAERSAALLADQVRRLGAVDLEPPLPNPEWVRWHAVPARHERAEAPAWLEDTSIRVRAKLAACGLQPVLGHADWEAQNMRWHGGRPLVVHDWDSLAWLPEAALAGTAAGVFASHGKPVLASIESSAAFLRAYEAGRGVPFTAYETEVA